MLRNCSYLAALALALAPSLRLASPQDAEAPENDFASPTAIVAAAYDVISGAAGEERDWDRLRSLFHPELGRLLPVARIPGSDGPELRPHTPEEYIEMAGGYFETAGFYETELHSKVEQYGAMAHVWSTYESRTAPDEEPFARGINSFQLTHDGERWWILSILWDAEGPHQAIPDEYLPERD